MNEQEAQPVVAADSANPVDVIAAAEERIPEPSKVITPVNTAEQFDPALHEVNKDTGLPAHNIDGSLKKKRGNKGKAAKVTRAAQSPSLGHSTEPIEDDSTFVLNGEIATDVGLAFASLLGPDWTANEAEKERLVKAADKYLRIKGIEMSPGWALFSEAIVFALPRVGTQETIRRLTLAGAKIGHLIGTAIVKIQNRQADRVNGNGRHHEPAMTGGRI